MGLQIDFQGDVETHFSRFQGWTIRGGLPFPRDRKPGSVNRKDLVDERQTRSQMIELARRHRNPGGGDLLPGESIRRTRDVLYRSEGVMAANGLKTTVRAPG